jgi:phospholipase/carboxylesterase
MHSKNVIKTGLSINDAKKALIMLHGRGGSAQDILSLASHLPLEDYYIVAPQATNNTWYPFGFMAPLQQNEPWLTSALDLVSSIVDDIKAARIATTDIYILGFSQGACLTLEFSTRHAQRWGGVIALTGGLIGDHLHTEHYTGNFQGTPVFMSNSTNDPHVPLSRSEESKKLMEQGGAQVTLQVYPNRPHTILPDELKRAAQLFT